MTNSLQGKHIRGYEILDIAGKGSFGVVYRARQPSVERNVAVKVIWPSLANETSFIQQFESEARLVAGLEHPHIVPLYDYWRDPAGAYLVMRWLPGGSLESSVGNGQWGIEATLALVSQVASALTFAHRYGIIHCDIKPENILLDNDANAYIGDFGIARLFAGNSSADDELGGSLAYAAPEQFFGGMLAPQTDQYSFALVVYEILSGQRPFGKLEKMTMQGIIDLRKKAIPPITDIRPDLPVALDKVLARATAFDVRDRFPDMLGFAEAMRDAFAFRANQQSENQYLVDSKLTRSPQGTIRTPGGTAIAEHLLPTIDDTITRNPYKGLQPFSEADSQDFFGREALVEHLLNRLVETDASSRILAVVGPSGSGKSSVVKAGLVPTIKHSRVPMLQQWVIAEMVPGINPFDELEIALLRVAVKSVTDLGSQLRRDERGLNRALQLVLPENVELLLIIDQFEELYTLTSDELARERFINSLIAALTDPHSRLRVVITLRADFYDRPLLHPTFSQLIRQRTEVVVPLNPSELEQVILGPANNVGLQVDQGIVTAISADVSQQPAGVLPLLQYVLSELFEQRDDNRLALDAYYELGGLWGALGQQAERIFEGLSDGAQQIARQLMLRLVTLGEGAEDTRRRIFLSEAKAIGDRSEQTEQVITVFGDARLITFDRDPMTRMPTLEVAHEAILREWPRMRQWLDESRHDVRQQRRLQAAAIAWKVANNDESYLLSGTRLDQYREWANASTINLTTDEQSLLSASIAHHEQQLQAEAARAERVRKLEERSRRTFQMLTGVFLVATLVAVALAVFAFDNRAIALEERETAQEERDNAQAARGELALSLLVKQVEDALESGDLLLANALSQHVLDHPDPPAEIVPLFSEIANTGPRHVLTGLPSAVRMVEFSQDGGIALATHADGLVVWDVQTGSRLHSIAVNDAVIFRAALSPDATTVVTAGADGNLVHYDIATGDMVQTYTGHVGPALSVAFNSTGDRLVSSGTNVILWDLNTAEPLRQFTVELPVGTLFSIADLNPDESKVAAASTATDAFIWDTLSGELLHELDAHTAELTTIVFSPDGTHLATASLDGTIIVWNAQDGSISQTLGTGENWITDVAFSPDGTTLVAAAEDKTILLWNIADGRLIRSYRGQTGIPYSVDINTQTNHIISAGTDQNVVIWDILPGDIVQVLPAHTDRVSTAVYSSDGNHALSAAWDGTVKVHHMASGDVLAVLEAHTGFVADARYSPDETLIATSGQGGTLLWDADTGELLQTLTNTDLRNFAWAADIAPDNRTVVAGAFDSRVIIWDIETGRVVATLDGHEGAIFDVRFSNDGQFVFSASDDGAVLLWNLNESEVVREFRGHSGSVEAIALSSADTLLASASQDGTVIIWEVATGDVLHVLEGHTEIVHGVNFSRDDAFVVSASADGTVIVWDAALGTVTTVLRNAGQSIFAATFHPNNTRVLAADDSGVLSEFQLRSLDEMLAWMQQNRATRQLTELEQSEYAVNALDTSVE